MNFISIDLINKKKRVMIFLGVLGQKLEGKKWKRYWEKINECDKWGHEMIEKEMEWCELYLSKLYFIYMICIFTCCLVSLY